MPLCGRGEGILSHICKMRIYSDFCLFCFHCCQTIIICQGVARSPYDIGQCSCMSDISLFLSSAVPSSSPSPSPSPSPSSLAGSYVSDLFLFVSAAARFRHCRMLMSRLPLKQIIFVMLKPGDINIMSRLYWIISKIM